MRRYQWRRGNRCGLSPRAGGPPQRLQAHASAVVLMAAILVPSPLPGQAAATTWDSVAAVLQTPTTPAAGYHRYNLPRRDIEVRMAGVTLATSMASGAWAGFSGDGREAVAMGDLVVLGPELGPVLFHSHGPAQVDPVLEALASHGITATAVHSHLVGESPTVHYVRFWADGTLDAVLDGLRAAIAAARRAV